MELQKIPSMKNNLMEKKKQEAQLFLISNCITKLQQSKPQHTDRETDT